MAEHELSLAQTAEAYVADLRRRLEVVRLIDSALASPNNTDNQRRQLLAARAQVLDDLVVGCRLALLDDEVALWAAVSGIATKAVNFWVSFMQMRGATKDDALTSADIGRLVCITRAVSWTETRHGTNTANFGDVDPMQMGNPGDAWWKSLTGQTPQSDRFVGGSGAGNYWAEQLPAAAVNTGMPIPPCPDVSVIDTALGHADPNFAQAISYYWGVAYLFLRINHTQGGDPFYLCGDLSYTRLFEGAVKYNGNPAQEAVYRQRLTDNLNQTQCLV